MVTIVIQFGNGQILIETALHSLRIPQVLINESTLLSYKQLKNLHLFSLCYLSITVDI